MKNAIFLLSIIGVTACEPVSVKQPVDVRITNPVLPGQTVPTDSCKCQRTEPFIFNLKGRDTIVEGPAFVTGSEDTFYLHFDVIGTYLVIPKNCSQLSISKGMKARFEKTGDQNFVWGYKLR